MQPNEQTVKTAVMLTTPQGRAVAMEHVLGIDHAALESHKTVLVHTTLGSFMVHDEAAQQVAVMFGLRPAQAQGPDPVAGTAKKTGKR